METKTIGIRDLLRNTKKITMAVARGTEFEVLNHTTPVFRIVPILQPRKKKYTFEDLMNFRIKSQDTHLSENVDFYVYGIGKKK